jgi:hypothetical protein
MEGPEGFSNNALVDKLEGITSRLEEQIGSFRLVGKNIQGDIERGFIFQPATELGDADDGVEEQGEE